MSTAADNILPGASQTTILVADDSSVCRKFLRNILHPQYNVIEAENGQEVIDLLRAGKPISCILLDMFMPVVDGPKVLQFMRDNGLADMIPVIVISAMSNASGKVACYTAGAFEVMEKPYDRLILLNRIENSIRLFARLNEARKRAEPDPGESAQFLSAVMDSLPEAVFVFEGTTHKVSYSNVAFSMLPGIQGPAPGKTLEEVFGPQDAQQIVNAVSDLLLTHVRRPLFIDLGGIRFSFAFNAILDENGNVAAAVGTAVNISGFTASR